MKSAVYRLGWLGGAVLLTLLPGSLPARAAEADVAPAQETRRMVLVLDASGSMWGQIDGRAKIDIAREVMTELIDQVPSDFETGLIVYGHRREGDCGDIEAVIPLGPHDPRAMKEAVQKIHPRGKTPLSGAVRQAARMLRHEERRATVVLVSDGLENCREDPCAVAAELAMSGADFTVHVIGFDIRREEQERLRCMADGTGGLFLAAADAGALREALRKAVDKVREAPAPLVADPGAATLRGPAKVPAGSAFPVTWEGPDSLGDYVALAPMGSDDDTHASHAYTKKGNPAELTAPGDEGEYELRYVHAHSRRVIGRAPLRVTPVQASVSGPERAGVATEFSVAWKGPCYVGDYVCVCRPGQEPGGYLYYRYAMDGNPAVLKAPSDPGTYELRYVMGRGDKVLATGTVDILPASARVEAPPSAAAASEFSVSWQGPDSRGDYVSIARPGDGPTDYAAYAHTAMGNPLTLRAPSEPGTYDVRYIQGQGDRLLARTTIQVEPVTARVDPPASARMATEFEVSWQGPGNEGDYISIARPGQAPVDYSEYAYTTGGNPLKLWAPSSPGSYEVRYILGQGDRVLARAALKVLPLTARIEAPSRVELGSPFQVRWEGPNRGGDYIAIARPEQAPNDYVHYAYTGEGRTLTLGAPDRPGKYEVRYILGRGDVPLARVPVVVPAP